MDRDSQIRERHARTQGRTQDTNDTQNKTSVPSVASAIQTAPTLPTQTVPTLATQTAPSDTTTSKTDPSLTPPTETAPASNTQSAPTSNMRSAPTISTNTRDILCINFDEKEEKVSEVDGEESGCEERDVSVVDLSEKFQEAVSLFLSLDCTVCFDHLCAPISQCSNGHLICEDCKNRIRDSPRRCPTCREDLGEIRSLIAESIVAKMKFPCRWNFMGCDGVFVSPDRRIHEQACKYRPFNCNICPWAGKENEIFTHMKSEHHFTELLDGEPLKNNENFGTYFLLMADQPSGCGHYAVVDGVKILVYVKMDEDMLMVSVRHAGAGRPGRFKVSVKLKDNNIVEWNSAMLSIREEINEFDDCICLRVPIYLLPIYSFTKAGMEFYWFPAVLKVLLEDGEDGSGLESA